MNEKEARRGGGWGKVTFLCMQKCDSTLISFSIDGRILKKTKKTKETGAGGE